jgi:nucleotide-binding universal stress UspA family protein
MLERILVPVDESVFARCALPAALALVRKVGGEIRLVHVIDRREAPGDDISAARSRMHIYLDDMARLHRVSVGISISTAVRDGDVAEELEAEAAEWGAEIIVMCTHGRSGVSRLWLGSVADRCLRRGFCPILLLRPTDDQDPARALRVERVVVPLDGSELSERALPYAASIARAFDVSALLLRVVTQPSAVEFFHHPEAMEFVHQSRDRDREEAADYLDARVTELHRAGIEAQALVAADSAPAQAITDRAEGDLVVMCTHGRGVLGRSVFGSVADKVVRGGAQPVLLIPVYGIAARLASPTS